MKEGKADLKIYKGKISKKLKVFYNPAMKLNRDISILLLNCLGNKYMQIALPLTGSGVRGIRFLLELDKNVYKKIVFNDYSNKSIELIKHNIKINELEKDYEISNKDANLFLLESKGFDYIDIDPFGTPNPFLESSILRLARGGILAVTATDTSALSGSSPKACKRKYWAKPLKNEFMHETGIRILIRKVQLIGAAFEKALTPIFSYTDQHYYRVFFKCKKGKKKADKILQKHKYLLYNPKTLEREVSDFNNKKGYDYAGLLWTGNLWDTKLAEKMYSKHQISNTQFHNLISLIKDECKINSVGYWDLHKLAKTKDKPIPKIESLLNKDATRTHFLGWGIKSKNSPKF
ncbi:MAG: tRNA (guanine(26)-N(2))-dimethyltransferase [Candidatus Woesearchaeota archaeon]|nr:tRNA (guanine(26)-N(2))-dimethyltransferase [Candidatus Woesearchaeota archaeon]